MIRYRPPHKPPPGAAHINWGHPLAQGLIIAWILNEGAGSRVNNPANRKDFGTITDLTWGIGPAGLYLENDEDTSTDSVINQTIVNGDKISVALRFSVDALTAQNKFLCGFRQGAAFEKDLTITSADKLQWYVQTSATDSVALETGRIYSALGVQNHAANFLGLYKDGLLVASGTSTSFLSYTAPAISLGGAGGAYAAKAFKAYYMYVWSRPLTAAEAMWLHIDPYAFLAPVGARVRWDTAAAAAGLFVKLAGEGGLAGRRGGLAA